MIEKHLAHIAGLEKKFGPNSEEVAVALNTLAFLICKYQDPADAIPYFERCLGITEQLRGPRAVLSDIDRWLNQDNSLEFKAREPFLLRRIEIRSQLLGERDVSLAEECESLAAIYLNRGRNADAKLFLERSLAIREGLGDISGPMVSGALEKLVDVSLRERQREQADLYLDRCTRLVEATSGANSEQMAQALVTLAAILISSGKYQRENRKSDGIYKAMPMFEKAFALYEQRFGPNSPQLQKALETISRACLDERQFWAAEPLLNRLLSMSEETHGKDAAALLWILAELAEGYVDQRSAEADMALERGFEVLRLFLDARRPIVRRDITDLPGNKEVLLVGRGGLLEKLARASERNRSNTRRRWGA